MTKIISIEGNIGSGKTTLLKHLKDQHKDNTNIIFLREPVDEWMKIKDEDGISMLEKFYKDQEKYSFPFQMMAYITRLSILHQAINANPDAIIITERSLFTDKEVFAKMLYDQKKIEYVNYQIYLNWFNEFAKEFPVNTIIYVKTEPEICHERISKRSRPGENVIPLEYLKDCDKYHEQFLSDDKLKENNWNRLLLDGNNDIFKNPDILQNWIQQIELELL
jgi:deoxyguanosine kinase